MIKLLLTRLEQQITRISATDFRPTAFSLKGLLVAVSYVYRFVVQARLFFYRIGVLHQQHLACPVISVGNIVAGGSGKTPTAVYLAQALTQSGYRTVVVSRGYKGQFSEPACVVGDGCQVFCDAATAGDEPYMMALRGKFPVVVGKRRFDAGRMAEQAFDPDVIVLDDGFQHMPLFRDMNIVLFDYDAPLGNGRMLPAGRLRESPKGAGHRIDAIVLTRCPQTFFKAGTTAVPPREIMELYPGIPVFFSRHRPVLAGFFPSGEPDTDSNLPLNLERVTGRRAVLFSGIAQNQRFRETVERLGVKVLAHLEFNDHYRYKRADFLKIRQLACDRGGDIVMTTEKDWVKVDRDMVWGMDLAVVGVTIEFEDPQRVMELLHNVVLKQRI